MLERVRPDEQYFVQAVQRFDPARGTRFGTYAAWWVHAYVRRYAYANRRIVSVPATRNARKVVWALRRARAEIQQRTGRDATVLRVTLEWALERLPDGMRQVLVLHDVEGFTHEEIGEMLGIAAGTSKSQLFKARARMRDLLRSADRDREGRAYAASEA